MNLNGFITFLLYAACAAYSFLAHHVLHLNVKEHKNIVLAVAFGALSVWAGAMAVANAAGTYQQALLWRRIAGFGWGTVFSNVLHFVLLISNHRWLRKKWILYLLYAPALVNLIVFVFYSPIANQQFALVKTASSWTNLWVNTFWNWFHMAYLFLFSFGTLYVLLQWLASTQDPREKRLAWLLLASFALALFAGVVSDYLIPDQGGLEALSQSAILFILFPSAVIVYIIRRYAFMQPLPDNEPR